jgi:hypothetical protein
MLQSALPDHNDFIFKDLPDLDELTLRRQFMLLSYLGGAPGE